MRKTKTLIAPEAVTLIYLALTLIFMVFLGDRLVDPSKMLWGRLYVVGGLVILWVLDYWRASKFTLFLRYMYPLALTGYWYPDCYEFCRCFEYQDVLFAELDQAVFGCQPALIFSENMPQLFWSELFHMGYFSYYLMIAAVVFVPLFACRRDKWQLTEDDAQMWGKSLLAKSSFVTISAFLLYYLIFDFLPVAGPQFYYPFAGLESVRHGSFPAIGDYFATHSDLPPYFGAEGFFQSLVEMMHRAGENPEAAFPSSHVGIGVVIVMLLAKMHKKTTIFIFILFVILCLSTVYIRAHYAVDVIGGLVSGLLFYLILWNVSNYFSSRAQV